jgi:hypothetical protein
MANSDEDELTPADLTSWLRQEIAELSKATELRLAEATDFVTAFAAGQITSDEAQSRLLRYQDRWGESPIFGVTVGEKTNEEIVRELDHCLSEREIRRVEQRQRSEGFRLR